MAVPKKKKPLSKTAKKKREALKRKTLKFRVVSNGNVGAGRATTKKVYKVTPTQVDDELYKLLVKAANERLRQIEKKGLTGYSREYTLVKKYAEEYPTGKGAIYNVNKKTGAIRFSRDLNKFITRDKPFKSQAERREYMINTLRNFLTAESSTIKGIRDIQKRGYESFRYEMKDGKKVLKEKYKDVSFEQYINFWRIYRENTSDSKNDHYGYDSLKFMIDHSAVMQLSEEDLESVMQTIESTKESDGDMWVAAENVKEIFGTELAWN